MWKKILPMALVLVVVFSFAACVGEPSAQEIIDGVFESLDDISTYQFDMDMTMEAAGEAEGEAFEMTMTMGFSGALDLENRQMRADTTMSMALPGEDEMEMGMEMYIIDDVGYMMTDMLGMEPTWMKSEISEADWEEVSEGMSQAESQLELLQGAQVEVIGSETVKGIDCYVLQLTPDMGQLWQTVMQQTQVAGEEILPEVDEIFLEEVFRSFSVKQWVAKDTYFITKAEIDMVMELTPEDLGFPEEEGEMTMNITMSYLAYNHNQPISIELPPEAEEAISLESAGYSEAAETELADIQMAVIAMMVDNEIATLLNPVIVATDDMSAFPDISVCGVDKMNDWDGNVYVYGKDKDGYVLYQHDLYADAASADLVNYIVSQYTTGTYTVDANGTVTQVTTGYE